MWAHVQTETVWKRIKESALLWPSKWSEILWSASNEKCVYTHKVPGSSLGWWWRHQWWIAACFSTQLSSAASSGWSLHGAGSWLTGRWTCPLWRQTWWRRETQSVRILKHGVMWKWVTAHLNFERWLYTSKVKALVWEQGNWWAFR